MAKIYILENVNTYVVFRKLFNFRINIFTNYILIPVDNFQITVQK